MIRTFKPTLQSGVLYARVRGANAPLMDIGGVAELQLSINEDVKKQKDFSRPGGGTRAKVSRVESVELSAKLQDLNAVNIARAVFGSTSTELAGTVAAEAVKGFKGGLLVLAKPQASNVVVKKGTVTIAAAGNFEVRPEGIYVLPTAADIADGDDLSVAYGYAGFDVVQALTTSAPELEMHFGGVNEADNGAPTIVQLFRVSLGATSGLGLIQDDFGTLDVKGEVLLDNTKSGAGVSRFFKIQMV